MNIVDTNAPPNIQYRNGKLLILLCEKYVPLINSIIVK